MRNAIEEILTAGTLAPSGDNCQPWRFEVSGTSIRVLLIPERDQSLYSWGNRASYIAHGALLENMSIAALPLGYTLAIEELPDPHNPLLTAHVVLQPTPPTAHPLVDAIRQRCSNRKLYKNTTLSSIQRDKLTQAGGESVVLIEDTPRRKKIAAAVAQNEKVLFENKEMHKFFFDHMLWNATQEHQNPVGFPIGTLELPPPIKALWPLFRHWSVMSKLTSIGFANAIVFGNTPIYASGAALACFTLRDRSEKEFLRIGRSVQRVWLTATSLGLSAQILTGIPLLMNTLEAGESGLSPTHSKLVRQQYQNIRDAVATDQPIAFLLRIGQSDLPSARTPRLPVAL